MSESNQPEFSPDLKDCRCCPRGCGADRTAGDLGYCGSGAGITIGSICAHRGEEPVISGEYGVCNIFFARCNMQCLFCQNFDISRTGESIHETEIDLEALVDRIEAHLDRGCRSVGFVSPSHFLPQMLSIIEAVKQRGRSPVFIYNSNGYDREAAVRALDGLIDVYLPDFKYADEQLAREFSDAPGYPAVAARAIGEMFRQKGAGITLDGDGLITSGMIIRHLVLPGNVQNSIDVLQHIARNWSPDCHLSLMSQYWPIPAVADHPVLGRRLNEEEYEQVLDAMGELGFHCGWVQELGSADHYRPDFMRDHPFEP